MPSPAQIHRMRALGRLSAEKVAAIAGTAVALHGVLAGLAAAAPPTPSGPAASEYELQRARLGIDLRRLSSIQARENKIALKRELLPGYAPWIEGVLAGTAASGKATQDDILVQIMIWRIDVGDYAGALPLVEHVLAHKLTLPERFKRTAATMIAEEFAEAALQALGRGEPFELAVLREIEALTAAEDIIDQANAKLHKAIGQLLARDAEASGPDADGPAGAQRAARAVALRYLKRALELDAKVGVKGEIQKIERAIAKQLPADDGAGTEQPADDAG